MNVNRDPPMINKVTLSHFQRAAADIADNGDNDTLPFDIDRRFIDEKRDELAKMAFEYFQRLETNGIEKAGKAISSLELFSERLLTPTGSAGFRITTKIHPFWNFYFNALGIAIAEAHQSQRSQRAMSYRFLPNGDSLFDRNFTWSAYLQATLDDNAAKDQEAIIIKTDISNFYEHVYHHRVENKIADLFPKDSSTISIQVDRFLSNFASGRSFGLPVGGQCSRILAELLMSSVDQKLSDSQISFYRYVDDFTIIALTQAKGYQALSALSHALADYGLSLNRTKTTILTAKHYSDYVSLQLGSQDSEANKLRQVNLYFDPYSDNPHSDFEELQETIAKLDVRKLLNLELEKSQPDAFLVSQISKTLRWHPPKITLQLCKTLLESQNLHAFRGSWSTIMRGITKIRADESTYSEIFDPIDVSLDEIPDYSPHLLIPETNCLFYLKTIRFKKTDKRAKYLATLYDSTSSETIKRACIECWCEWKDRSQFTSLRNKWNTLGIESQRMLWLGAKSFDDEGKHFRNQVKLSLRNRWRLGIEKNDSESSFATLYEKWEQKDV